MGAFRLILSLLVVSSHIGGLGGTPAGGTGIAGFFAISGFLMARTITENYPARGFMRFYANRLLRIMPPYLVVAAASALFLWLRNSAGFEIVQGATSRYMPIELPSSTVGLVAWQWSGFPLFIRPSTTLLPQTWSLVVEGIFYLLAPLMVALMAGRLSPLVWMITAASLACAVSSTIGIRATPGGWMRSPVASLWIFNAGVLAYYAAPLAHCSDVVRRRCRQWSVLPLVLAVFAGIGLSGLRPEAVFMLVPVLVIGWLVLGEWSTRTSSPLDRARGNLAYGVFLGHYLSTLVMMWIAETVYASTGMFGLFGGPDDTRWIVYLYGFALTMGAMIYFGVERPFERLRSFVRKRNAVAMPAKLMARSDVLT